MKNYSNRCPTCGNADGNLSLEHRGQVPTLQNVTLPTKEKAESFPTGVLHFLRCGLCSFVWNAAFDENIILYGDDYNNDVSMSDYYGRHLASMAKTVVASIPLGEPLRYVEIGCGKGDFLRLVVERAGGRCESATGFDPSFTSNDALPGNAVVHKNFFTPDQLDLVPAGTNVVCCRHTIEHVSDVRSFADALCAPISHAGVRLFTETPDANWILRNVAFQDFFYEHCSLYTPESIQKLFGIHDLVSEVSPVYGGQYMWVESRVGQMADAGNSDDISASDARNYIEKRSKMIAEWSSYIVERNKAGSVAIWGAASKGVTFSMLFTDSVEAQIDCAIDLNTAKQNRFLPVTGMPVLGPEAAMKRGVQTIIIMNPNYENEIKAMAADLNWFPEFATLNG